MQIAKFLRKQSTRRLSRHSLTIGFVPMIDCGILIAAKELGLFEKHGVTVKLSREVGWATIREKLLHEELDAVHAPASLSFAMRCGINMVARPCLTAFVLSLNGSAITLSNELWDRGVRDAATLRQVILEDRGRRIYSFGAVLEFSTQNYNLRSWLRSGGIDPDRDVRIPIVPSPVIHRGLLEGHLDGYCVAEPWNSIVAQSGNGWVVATASEIDNGSTEKVLLVLEKFAEDHSAEHLAVVAALIEASIFCEQPSNRPELVRILARPEYIDVPESLLANSLIRPFRTGRGEKDIDDFIIFHRDGANIPDRAKGRRVFKEVRAFPAAKSCKALRPDVVGRIFREDLYHAASELVNPRERPSLGSSDDRDYASPQNACQSFPPFPAQFALAS